MSAPTHRLLSLLGWLALAPLFPPTARADTAPVPPPWAYGFKTPPPATAAVAPAPAAAAAVAPVAADPTKFHLPGSAQEFTRAEITDIFAPADWYPQDHPPMPAIVAHGKAPVVWACARCHYPNGQGRPENAPIAGLPAAYFLAQLQAFRDGERVSADPRKPNTRMMVDFARAMTEEEMRAAADYFAAVPAARWIRVVEADRVPATTTSAGMYLPVANAPDEPIDERIIEVPEDVDAVENLRSPRVGFIAYVPRGSVGRGETLVTSGGGRTVACATCHGPDLRGMTTADAVVTPGIAGRSPSYLMRQLFDIQRGLRRGRHVELMQPVVAPLRVEELRDIVAYLATLAP